MAPLGELLALYGTLCLYFGREFAAGPAALGPAFQVRGGGAARLVGAPCGARGCCAAPCVALAPRPCPPAAALLQESLAQSLPGVQLLAALPAPVGRRQEVETEAGRGPVLALSRQGLAAAVGAAAAAAPPAERGASAAQMLRTCISQAAGVPASLPPAVLPPADECAASLASCAAGVPALAATGRQLGQGRGPDSEVRAAALSAPCHSRRTCRLRGQQGCRLVAPGGTRRHLMAPCVLHPAAPCPQVQAALAQLRRLRLWRDLLLGACHRANTAFVDMSQRACRFGDLTRLCQQVRRRPCAWLHYPARAGARQGL